MTQSDPTYIPQALTVTVVVNRPGWRATAVLDNGAEYEQTGGTVHSTVTKALAAAGLICSQHLVAARTRCRS